eukprot:TRINITY_DN5843_c0_g2_i1.p1 TRINITY_DN5843_c0_g2~~TRINITY_DN5843_c0_g2_i1.p1  ORF type:complete len:190 (+),score=1.10 TRINITY_DN5843_c0_g2_i1:324-893(+)
MLFKQLGYSLAFVLALGMSGSLQAESSGDSSVESLKKETRELGQALQEFGADQKAEAETATENTLTALDKRIDTLQQELDQNWDDMSDTARERSRKSLESLQEQRQRVQQWYDELQADNKRHDSRRHAPLNRVVNPAQITAMHQQAGNRQMTGTTPTRPAGFHYPGEYAEQYQRKQHAYQQERKRLSEG